MLYSELDGSDIGGGGFAPVSMMDDSQYGARPPAPPPATYASQQQQQHAQHAIAPPPPVVQQVRYTPQQAAYMASQVAQTGQEYATPPRGRRYGPSYLEQLWSSRREINKLLMLSFIVTIGLALHGCAKLILKHVMTDKILSFNQELLIRSSYPLLVLFVAWNLRLALQASKW